MKIGIVCYPTFGGSGIVATELAKILGEKGHEIHIISYSHPFRLGMFSENVIYHEVSVSDYPLFAQLPYETALTSKIVEIVKYAKLDVLHVHYAIPHASAAFMAREILKKENIYIPFITTLHGTDISLVGKDPSYHPVVKFSIEASDVITTVSESLKEETIQFFDIKNEIHVIPNFIDLDRFKPKEQRCKKKSICPNDEKLIAHMSNFRPVKRIQDVIRVFALLRKKTKVKLMLIGDGPERSNLESLCRELKLCDDIRFVGKTEAIQEALSLADLFFMPSEKESFGLAALEAMACSVPVISSDAGGLPELNVHGTTGFLSPVGDLDRMVEYALEILDDKNIQNFKKNALEQASNFSVEKIVPQYEKLYEQVLESTSI